MGNEVSLNRDDSKPSNDHSYHSPIFRPSNYFAKLPSSVLFTKIEKELVKKLFEDLSKRSERNGVIDKATFCRIFPLPGVLGESLFRIFDRSGMNEIQRNNFFDGIAVIIKGSIKDRISFLFELFDLDRTGEISKTDLETVLNCIVSARQSYNSDNEHKRSQLFSSNGYKMAKHLSSAVKKCEQVVQTLLDDAFNENEVTNKSGNNYSLNLEQFARWIIEHNYLWYVYIFVFIYI